MGGKFDPQIFFQRAENIGLYVPAADVLGFSRRTLDLPGAWAALVTGQAGEDTVIPAGAAIDGGDLEDVLFVRITAFDIDYDVKQLHTSDDFDCRVDVQLRLRLIPERGELVSFRSTIQASHRVIQTDHIVSYFDSIIRSTVSTFTAEHQADSLVESKTQEQLSHALTDALDGPCFSSGLVLDAPPVVRVESSSLKKVQQVKTDSARRHAEHQAAKPLRAALKQAQHEHLDHLSSLLVRLNELADASPNIKLPELVRTFNEQQRGEIYEAIFATDAAENLTSKKHTQWIVVSAGDELLFFDPANLEAPVRQIPIALDAGAVRSVQYVENHNNQRYLLLGAAKGVYRMGVDASTPEATFLVDHPPEVRGGFNAVAQVGDRIVASHSEIGIYQWHANETSGGKLLFESITRGAGAIRFIQQDSGDFYCSVDDKILRWSAHSDDEKPSQIYIGSRSTITSLMICSEGLFAGNSSGEVLHWPVGGSSPTLAAQEWGTHLDEPVILHRGQHRAVESIHLYESQGIRRLIYTNTSLYVHALVLGDTFSGRYEAGGQTLRRVNVAPDMLVATTELRDRLIVWKPGKPNQPDATISVSRICNRSVQDVCLIPMA